MLLLANHTRTLVVYQNLIYKNLISDHFNVMKIKLLMISIIKVLNICLNNQAQYITYACYTIFVLVFFFRNVMYSN